MFVADADVEGATGSRGSADGLAEADEAMAAYPPATGAFTESVSSSVPDPEVRDSVGTF